MKIHPLKKTMTLCALGCMLASSQALADTSGKKIAFSNNYAGNSWRQAMLSSYDAVAKKAVADKVVKAAEVFTTADKAVPTQAAQIQNLILQGYDAIVINASSPDALNGADKKACDAGIVVVSFDGLVTEPCAYRVVVDFKEMGRQEVVREHALQRCRQHCLHAAALDPRRHAVEGGLAFRRDGRAGIDQHELVEQPAVAHGERDRDEAAEAIAQKVDRAAETERLQIFGNSVGKIFQPGAGRRRTSKARQVDQPQRAFGGEPRCDAAGDPRCRLCAVWFVSG